MRTKERAEARMVARPARILIVDDHPVFRLGLARMLDLEEGLAVCGEAQSAEEAFESLDELAPDMVVVDVSLPGANGLELVKGLKERRPELPALVLSMHDEVLFAGRSLRAGARGYVNKQEPVEEMIAAVREVLAGGTYLSPRMRTRLAARTGAAAGELDAPAACLSDRELEVFGLIGEGLGTREIAERLGLAVKTVETYREHVKEKLGLESGPELARRAVAWVLAQG
ncbi:MAG TPA: response regulator transcription factor [Thermoanaerobaculia bacterium]|nr:response regulator transcription factor [Thermoanaerobaculia bacterium]